MAKSINAMWNEAKAEERDMIIKELIKLGDSDDHIAAAVHLPVSKIAEIRSTMEQKA